MSVTAVALGQGKVESRSQPVLTARRVRACASKFAEIGDDTDHGQGMLGVIRAKDVGVAKSVQREAACHVYLVAYIFLLCFVRTLSLLRRSAD